MKVIVIDDEAKTTSLPTDVDEPGQAQSEGAFYKGKALDNKQTHHMRAKHPSNKDRTTVLQQRKRRLSKVDFNPSDISSDQAFIKFIPANDDARKAFHDHVARLKAKSPTHQSSAAFTAVTNMMKATKKQRTCDGGGTVRPKSDKKSKKVMYAGSFDFGLGSPRTPEDLSFGIWIAIRMPRVNANVKTQVN